MTLQRSWCVFTVCAVVLACAGERTDGGAEAGARAASVSAGAASIARAVPVMVRLQDGRVLAAGGSGGLGPQAACDLFDPQTGAWTAAAPMTMPREYHSLTALADGRALAVGGYNRVGFTYDVARTEAEIFDPATGTWTAVAPMHQGRFQHGAVRLLDGRVLVAGGLGAAATIDQLASAEIYDPAADTWTPTAPMPSAASDLVLLSDGRVLGGASNAHLVLYDPAADLWTDAGPPPASTFVTGPMSGAMVRLADGRVLQSGSSAGATWIWNPATGTWAASAALLPSRFEHRLVVADDGTVLAIGGNTTAPLALVQRYHPETDSWTSEPPLTEARATPAATLLADGRILVLGGRSTATGTWKALATAELIPVQACTPKAEACAGKTCGTVSDGCGGTFSCGTCAAGSTCSANVCVCTPTTCAAQGKTCGTVSDGCGGTLSCGTCAAGSTCSASNICVCAPTSCAAQGKTCGSIPDGCGGTLSCGTCAGGSICSANVCVAPPGAPVRDASLGAPRCTSAGPVCDSGTLLVGRGPLGPEVGRPNTLGASCADGTGGAFHFDESLDALRISSVDGGPLAAGKQARIEATVWAFSAANSLDLYFAANAAAPAWTLIATLTPAGSGAHVLSTTFTLPRGELQAIRGTFRYGGSPGACTSGSYDDHDDLVFPVATPPDVTPPIVNMSWPPANVTVSGTVSVSAIIADDVGVASVDFLVDGQVASTRTTEPYTWAWNTVAGSNGWHYVGVRARDAAGNVGEAPPVAVWVDNDRTPPTVSLTAPLPGALVSGAVPLSASAFDTVGVASVEFRVDGVVLATDTAAPYEALWSSDGYSTGAHTITAVARDAAGNSASTSVTVTVQQPPAPTTGIAAYDPILGAPACSGAAASCDSGPTLLAGRGTPREPNAPNTIDACVESSYGTFHVDESIDAVRIVAADGATLAPSAPARVVVTIYPWASGSSDVLDVYVADVSSAPVWRYAGSALPAGSGLQTLTVPVTLSAAPRQAVRAVFRYGGTQSPCPGGNYDDVDDLAFDVNP